MKDKANHFLHHQKPKSDLYMKKSKQKYDRSDIPAEVKELVELMGDHCKGYRYGNHRKMYAKLKVSERRGERVKGKEEFRKELKDSEY